MMNFEFVAIVKSFEFTLQVIRLGIVLDFGIMCAINE